MEEREIVEAIVVKTATPAIVLSYIDERYQNGMIYGIYRKDTDECLYVGSTKDEHSREVKHRSATTNINDPAYNTKLYVFIRINGGWNNFEMKHIEPFPCWSKSQLLKHEGNITRLLNPPLNSNIAGRTRSEWKYDKYHDKNHKYRKCMLKRKHEDYIKHREQRIQKVKEYVNLNKDKVRLRISQKVECKECGELISYSNFRRHVKTVHKVIE